MRSRSAVSQSYVDTQLMIPRKKPDAGSVVIQGGGAAPCVMPWFWGFCVDNPTESDTVSAHVGGGADFLYLFPFYLPATCLIDFITYRVMSTLIDGEIAVGIYDADNLLSFQMEPLAIGPSTGTGLFTFELPDTVELTCGSKIMAIAASGCNNVLSLKGNGAARRIGNEKSLKYAAGFMAENFVFPDDWRTLSFLDTSGAEVPLMFFEPRPDADAPLLP